MMYIVYMQFNIPLEYKTYFPYSAGVLEQKIKDKYGDYLTIQVDRYIFKVPINSLCFELDRITDYRKSVLRRFKRADK